MLKEHRRRASTEKCSRGYLVVRKKYKYEGTSTNCINRCVVGFEVFTAAVMKSIIFWDMTPCSP
jgi:hypothetical protein